MGGVTDTRDLSGAMHLTARFARAFVAVADRRIGQRRVDEILRTIGAARADFDDETSWFSLSFYETLSQELIRASGSDEILQEIGRQSFTPRAFGFLYPFIRAFGSPEILYRKIVEYLPRANKIATMRIVELSRGHTLLEYTPLPGAPRERERMMCAIRSAQFVSVPTLFGMPAARLVEHQCQGRGAPRCVYELTWLSERRALGLIVGTILGAGGGALLTSRVLVQSGWWSLLLCMATGLGFGALIDARRENRRRRDYIEQQNVAISASAEASERRFAELLAAKKEVDRKVERRTAELEGALEKLRELDRAKNDFFANVSHELRTPLTLILGPLEQMRERPEQVQAEDLAVMHRNAVRLLHLINQILEVAKADAGKLRIRPEPTELAALVTRVARPFEPLARQRGVELELKTDVLLPAVSLDAEKVDVALSNLVANALKFTPRGGRVEVVIACDREDALVAVRDTGPGIPPEQQQRVFERFSSSARGGEGTGIGLALVREIAQLHGGQVELTSRSGEGACFALRLPLDASRIPTESIDRRQAEVPVRDGRRREDVDPWTTLGGTTDAAAALASAPPAASAATDGRRPTGSESPVVPEPPPGAPLVMVVEDHAELRAFVARSLRGRYRVSTAADGRSALEGIRTQLPDLVLSDVMMPQMDGYQLCRELKARVDTRPIPVILLTAKSGTERALEGFAAGADDYLAKPFNTRELLARVEVHLRVRTLMREMVQRDKLALLGTVAAGIAHEVRNPLSVVQGVLPRLGRELKAGDGANGATTDALSVVEEAVGRITSVTQALLDLSGIDREGARPWEPREGVEATIRLLRARPDGARGLVFKAGAGGLVNARPGELNQVLLNVIDNALRASGEDGCVEVATRIDGSDYVIEVIDDGPGIAPDVLPRIFDPFFSTRQAGEGTGLGLSIANKIVAEHLGSLDVACPDRGGTQVTIRLPLERSEVVA